MGDPNLGARLLALRRHRGLTQAQLADRADCSTASISQWERGIHTPYRRTVRRLAKHLGTSAEWLLGLDGAVDPMPDTEHGLTGRGGPIDAPEDPSDLGKRIGARSPVTSPPTNYVCDCPMAGLGNLLDCSQARAMSVCPCACHRPWRNL